MIIPFVSGNTVRTLTSTCYTLPHYSSSSLNSLSFKFFPLFIIQKWAVTGIYFAREPYYDSIILLEKKKFQIKQVIPQTEQLTKYVLFWLYVFQLESLKFKNTYAWNSGVPNNSSPHQFWYLVRDELMLTHLLQPGNKQRWPWQEMQPFSWSLQNCNIFDVITHM